jgi:hypothetical protein
MLTRNFSLIHGVMCASALRHAGCSAPVADARDELRTLAAGDAFAPFSIAGSSIRASGEVLLCDRGLLIARPVEERLLDVVWTQSSARQSVADRESGTGGAAIRANANSRNRPPFRVCSRMASRKRHSSDMQRRA